MTRALVLMALLLTPASVFGQTLQSVFAQANADAAQGHYEKAIAQYARLIESGIDDADVHANLATVYAKSGDLPRAILFFEKALKARPGDDNAALGLRAAQQALAGARAEAEGEATIQQDTSVLASMFRRWSEPALAWSVLVVNAIFFSLIAILLWRKPTGGLRAGVSIATVLCLLLLGTFSVGLFQKAGVFDEGTPAIVLSDKTPLREGPNNNATERAIGRAGERGQIVDHAPGFVLFVLKDGRRGWVGAQNVSPI